MRKRFEHVRVGNVIYTKFRSDDLPLEQRVSQDLRRTAARKESSRIRAMIDSIWEFLRRTKPVDEVLAEADSASDEADRCIQETKGFLDSEPLQK